MRRVPALLSFALLAGCAGNVADYIGPRASIVSAQLTRYGLNLRESRCVGEALGASLTPLQLRRLERAADSVRDGYFEPDRLTMRDLIHVAGSMDDPQVRLELARAAAGCAVTEVAARREAGRVHSVIAYGNERRVLGTTRHRASDDEKNQHNSAY